MVVGNKANNLCTSDIWYSWFGTATKYKQKKKKKSGIYPCAQNETLNTKLKVLSLKQKQTLQFWGA